MFADTAVQFNLAGRHIFLQTKLHKQIHFLFIVLEICKTYSFQIDFHLYYINLYTH